MNEEPAYVLIFNETKTLKRIKVMRQALVFSILSLFLMPVFSGSTLDTATFSRLLQAL